MGCAEPFKRWEDKHFEALIPSKRYLIEWKSLTFPRKLSCTAHRF